jgi:cytidylate kinase
MMLQTTNSQIDEATMSGPKQDGIAIDGPAGAGKSTVAQRVAQRLQYLYIDTGAMYRAATWISLERKANLEDDAEVIRLVEASRIDLQPPDESSRGRVRVFINETDVTMIVRSRIVTRFVSQISAIAGIRKIMVARQQQMADRGRVVMDGRDIGTVVLPRAALKIFLTASPEVRADRRLKELKEMGQAADLNTLLEEIKARDHFDSTRATSPLRQADDAIVINTDNLTIDQVVQQILSLAQARL